MLRKLIAGYMTSYNIVKKAKKKVMFSIPFLESTKNLTDKREMT